MHDRFSAVATGATSPEVASAWQDAARHVAEGEDDKARTRLRYAQSRPGATGAEAAAIQSLTGAPLDDVASPSPRLYRVPPVYVGPHGCDVCGHNTTEGTFDPTAPCPECGTVYGLDLRRLVQKALDALGEGAPRAVAKAVAVRWGVSWQSAEQSLCSWLAGRLDQIPMRGLAAVLDALGLVVCPEG